MDPTYLSCFCNHTKGTRVGNNDPGSRTHSGRDDQTSRCHQQHSRHGRSASSYKHPPPPPRDTTGMLQSSQSAHNVMQQPHTQAIHMPGLHLSGQVPLIASGATNVGLSTNNQLNYAAVQHANNHAVNPEPPIIPSIQALRTTAVNQDLVRQRLQELNQLALPHHQGNHIPYNLPLPCPTQAPNKPKGKKEKVNIVWPQDCAFVGHLRARVSYEQLTQAQFVLGFLRSMQEEQGVCIKGNMVEYLIELFQNICDHSWQATKGPILWS